MHHLWFPIVTWRMLSPQSLNNPYSTVSVTITDQISLILDMRGIIIRKLLICQKTVSVNITVYHDSNEI